MMTLKAIRLIRENDVIAVPGKIANGYSPNAFGFVILGADLIILGIIAMLFIYKKKNL